MAKKQKLTPEQLLETTINKMFEIAGHSVTYNDIKLRTDAWYQEYTMTEEQNKEWTDWLTEVLKKERRHYTAKMLRNEVGMINLMYGLKISNYDSI